MKKIMLILVIVFVTACTTTKEVRMTDSNLELKGVELHYMGEPFTGVLIQQIPLTESELRIEYKDGIPKTPNIKE